MSTLRTSVIVDLTGNLERRAQRFAGAMGDMSKRGQRHLFALSRVAAATGNALDRVGNRYTALITGAAGVGTAKMLIDLERRFTRLGISANASVDEVKTLKKEIYEAAQAPDIRIDPSQITSAIESIVEKTGDLQFARDNIRNIGLTLQATGADGQAVGEVFGEFQKMGIKSSKEVLEAIDMLNKQGKEGAFTLANLAALGPRVITAYTATGRVGVPALREMGAALQMIRMGTGSSEMAATAFEATLRTLTDPQKVKALRQLGVNVFDPERLAKGERVLRPINELMAEIIQKTKGDPLKMGKVFDAEAIRAFNQAAGEFKRTGQLDSLQTLMAMQGDGATTMQDSARAAHDAAGALESLYTVWKRFSDETLTGPMQWLAGLAPGSETGGAVMKGIGVGGAILGGAVLARKAYKGFGGLFGKGAAAGAAGGLGGMPLPLPVYVVNSHMSLTPDQWGGGPAGGAAAGGAAAGKWGSRALKFGSRAFALGGAAMAGWEIGGFLNDHNSQSTKDRDGRNVARVLAFFGNQEAKDAIAREERFAKANELNGKIVLEVKSDPGVKVQAKELHSDNPGVELEADSGVRAVAY